MLLGEVQDKCSLRYTSRVPWMHIEGQRAVCLTVGDFEQELGGFRGFRFRSSGYEFVYGTDEGDGKH